MRLPTPVSCLLASTVAPGALVGPFDPSDPNGLATLVYILAAVELLYLAFWISRAARAGRLLFEFSPPNRKWWWFAAANMAIVITSLLSGSGTSRASAVLFLSQAVICGVQAMWGVQARERGLLTPFEFVPWKRVDFRWTEPNRVFVTVRRSLNWNTTYKFPVTREEQSVIAHLLRGISGASAH